jgi:hypothetical protein
MIFRFLQNLARAKYFTKERGYLVLGKVDFFLRTIFICSAFVIVFGGILYFNSANPSNYAFILTIDPTSAMEGSGQDN